MEPSFVMPSQTITGDRKKDLTLISFKEFCNSSPALASAMIDAAVSVDYTSAVDDKGKVSVAVPQL